MKNKITLLFLFLLVAWNSSGQDMHLIDSLQARLNNTSQDTARANTLFQLSKAYWGIDPQKAMEYASQSLALSDQAGYRKGTANAFNSMGVIYYSKGNYVLATDYQAKALVIYEETGNKSGIANCLKDIGSILYSQGNYEGALQKYQEAIRVSEEIGYQQIIARSLTNIGNIFNRQGNYTEALKNYFSAITILQNINDKKGLAYTYNNIGIIYHNQGNYPEALKNHLASLKLKEEIGDKKGIADSYNNIGIVYNRQNNYPEAIRNYTNALKIKEEIGDKKGIADIHNNIGNVFFSEGNYSKALNNYKEALKINEEIGVKYGIAYSYNNIGNAYTNQGNYPAALENLFAALKIREESGDKSGIASTYLNIGDVFFKQRKYTEARQFLNNGLILSKQTGNLENISKSYFSLSTLDSAGGNFRQAYENHKQYIAARDSLVNEENTKKTLQQQLQYEFDKKEAITRAEQDKKDALANKEIQKQKLVRNSFVGGFAIVLIFAGVFFYQRNKIGKEKKKSDTEKKRSEELLLNILPYEVAEELKTTGAAKARTYSMVSVMFSDFKDFTRVSEKISAELLVDEIHHCFSAYDAILQKYKIEKIKTIGDAYMCASGLPALSYTHALDLVRAAIEIRDFMLARKKEKETRGEIPFELRIGIHTGPVVAGIVGVKKFAYDIWGDTVNIAARMEQNSEAGKINISGSTFQLVKDKYQCIYRGKIEAKNKGEVDMYFVEAPLS